MRDTRVRIGFVISHLSHGGAQRQVYQLVRVLDPARFHCFVYSLSERISPYGDMIRETGTSLRVLKRQGHFDAIRIFKLASLLRKDRVDILHSFLFVANGYAWPAQLLSAVPHLVTSARNCKEIGVIRGWINRLAFRMSDAVACNGDAVRSYVMRHYHAPSKKSVVINNGLDLTRFAAAHHSIEEKANGCGSAERIVMTIGRLVPQKDLLLFLDAATLLSRQAPEVRFVIVGDGPCRSDLMRAACQNGLDGKVSFLGERDDIPQLLATTDVFWLTSQWEGLPNVVLEAMACGKPVIARDVGACCEVINNGENGYLVRGRDAAQFAGYTLELLTDPARAKGMGLAGRKLVEEKFSVARMIEATQTLYCSLLQARADGRA